MKKLSEFERVHIVGIGGAGMSAIARVLQGRGIAVQGSDQQEGQLVTALRAEGIPVTVGHAAENIAGADLVLASSAIPVGNVELAAARAREIPTMRRPEFLAQLTAGYDVVAIAGAHGKTTVTGMIITTLLAAGRDPTYIVGGVVENLGTNAHVGQDKLFVIEADEYQNTFLSLTPQLAVVTNIEFDHPDCFPSVRFVRLAFGEFVDQIRPAGALVACNDDKLTHLVGASYHANGGRLLFYGQVEGRGLAWRAVELHPNERGGITFTALHEGDVAATISLQLPGEHNALNALAALAVTTELGIPTETACAALEAFAGTARRFEVLGTAQDVVVVDDYAHHPTQIKAVLRAARQRYAERRIIAVWQPHTFSRIKALWDGFVTAFDGADEVLVLPIYAAREVDDGTVDHRELAAQLTAPEVQAMGSLAEATQQLVDMAAPGDLVLLLGAGDEYVVGWDLLAALRRD
ncbi:MAG: UDP-N-acetylmuramate--L-alanine ligase [Chloroflexota bacterium]|nr:UDP-N-acetylmuramate--L-alanine ligase [Chloroflexota bacterium]